MLAAAARVVTLPLYLLGLLFRGVWYVRGRFGSRPRPPARRPLRLPGHPLPPRRDGEWLVNDAHRCRVKLPPGAEPVEPGTTWSRHGIWSVFAVGLDAETTVTCEAWPLSELRQISPHGTVMRDESRHVGGFKARRRVLETQSGDRQLQREVYVIQMPRALYVWELPDVRDEARRERFRSLVESFEPAS